MNCKRVLFSKTDELVFISHLDLAHSFIRALNRADMPIAYSSGFNPHPKIVFALPLSVGMAGQNELCDITLTDDSVSNEQFFKALREEMPEHILIKKVYNPDTAFGNVKSASYTVSIERTGLADGLTKALSAPLVTMKKTKSGEKEVDLLPRILSFKIAENTDSTTLLLSLVAAGDNYTNPELVMTALKKIGVISDDDSYFISRDMILFD